MHYKRVALAGHQRGVRRSGRAAREVWALQRQVREPHPQDAQALLGLLIALPLGLGCWGVIAGVCYTVAALPS